MLLAIVLIMSITCIVWVTNARVTKTKSTVTKVCVAGLYAVENTGIELHMASITLVLALVPLQNFPTDSELAFTVLALFGANLH